MAPLRYIVLFLSLFITGIYAQKQGMLTIPVLPDTLIKVDSIKITGNSTTEDFVILRELTFKEGDEVSYKTLEFNRERVFSLGLFNDVNVTNEFAEGKNKILIAVEESWYIYPIPFIRFKDRESNETTYGINFLYKNFRGRNETLRALISFGYDPSYSLVYNIPVLLNMKKLGIGFLFNYTNFENKTEEGRRLNRGDFNYKAVISRAYLNYRFDQFNFLMGLTGFEYYEAPSKNFNSISASKERIDRFPVAGINYIYDSRDLKQYAAVGSMLDLKFTHKGFGLDGILYSIFDLDLRKYNSIYGDLIWKGRIKTRSVIGGNIPLYDYSLLGYEEYIRGNSRRKFDGKTYFLTSAELSYPIVKEWDMKLKLPLLPESLTSARIGIQFSIFADAGTAFDNYNDFSYGNVTYGWGFGINFLLLPYNGFRIEYAFDKNMNGEVLIATGFSF